MSSTTTSQIGRVGIGRSGPGSGWARAIAVARAANVSRSWLYGQPDLHAAVIALRRIDATPNNAPTPLAQRASTESLRQCLDSAREEIAVLRVDNAALREQLARSLGEQRLRR